MNLKSEIESLNQVYIIDFLCILNYIEVDSIFSSSSHSFDIHLYFNISINNLLLIYVNDHLNNLINISSSIITNSI